MAYCSGCGAYVGDYSFFRQKIPGKGELTLCYRCKRWSDRHPAQTTFPSSSSQLAAEERRIRTISTIYIIAALGIFVAGGLMVLSGKRVGFGLVIILGAVSLLFVGWGMRKPSASTRKKSKQDVEKDEQ